MKTTTFYPELQTDGARTSLIRRILNTPSLLAGGIMFAVLILLAVFIPYISPYDPTEQNLSAFCSRRPLSTGLELTSWGVTCSPD